MTEKIHLVYSSVFLSALLYSCSFVFHSYFWWLIFFFPVPLFYLAKHNVSLSYKEGFIWGGSTALMHSFGCLLVIVSMAQEYWHYGVIVAAAFVIYCAFFVSALWGLSNYIIMRACLSRYYSVPVLLAVQFFLLDRFLLAVFGVCEGYPLLNPLCLLAHAPCLLYLFADIPFFVGLLFLFCSVLVLYSFFCERTSKAAIIMCITLMPWVCACLLYKKNYQKISAAFVSRIGVITDVVSCASHYHSCLLIADKIRNALNNSPEISTIIMPESFLSDCRDDFFWAWSRRMLGKKITIIGGGERCDSSGFYNCLYWVRNGKVRGMYDKTHTMLLSERLPSVCSFLSLLYRSTGKKEVTKGNLPRFALGLADDFLVAPYICSEFFFSSELPVVSASLAVLVLVNDSFFMTHWLSAYGADLLLLLARYKALVHRQDIIYVGYQHACFITRWGEVSELARIK